MIYQIFCVWKLSNTQAFYQSILSQISAFNLDKRTEGRKDYGFFELLLSLPLSFGTNGFLNNH